MSIEFPIELKTGFFKQEECVVRIDHNISQLFFDFKEKSDVYIVDFADIKRIIYAPGIKDEIEFHTNHNTYIGYIGKGDLRHGLVDLLRIEFGDRFREIKM